METPDRGRPVEPGPRGSVQRPGRARRARYERGTPPRSPRPIPGKT